MPPTEKKEYLAFEFKVDEAEDNKDVGYIEGYASTFGNVDQGYDIVVKGAFTKTLKEKGGIVPILLDHRMDKHAGWNIEAKEDDKGLKVKGELDLSNTEVRSRYNLAKRAKQLGAKMGLSIGYTATKFSYEKDQKNETGPLIRLLKEVKWFEYSMLVFPMNDKATVTGVKAAHQALLEIIDGKDYDLDKLKMALVSAEKSVGAAEPEVDPCKVAQSIDTMIRRLKG